MEQLSIGFIGGGKVTRIFLLSFRSKNISFRQIKFSEIQEDKSKKLEQAFPEVNSAEMDEVMHQDIIFSTVHPPALLEILDMYKGKLSDSQILVSVSPKLELKELEDRMRGFKNIARFIPNVPSIISKGYNPVSYAKGMNIDKKVVLCNILSILGKCIEVDESKLEAYSILTAMGPTYFWFQVYELQKLGKSYGLTDEEIKEGITEMIKGSLKTMFSSKISREEILDLISVKPLAEIEDIVSDSYEQVLTILSKKLKV